MLVGLGLLAWALPHISVSELLAQPPKRPEGASVTGYFMAGLTAMVGFWATLSLNIPDFSRYARSQKDQILGQIFGLPLTMFLFAALGVVMTAASASLVGETVSDPVSLIGHIPSPGWVAVAMALIIVATLSTNTAANIVSPTNDFQNIAPKLIGRTRAVWLTGFIGLALMAHELLKKLGWIVSDLSLESVYPTGCSATPACSGRSRGSWWWTTSWCAGNASTLPDSTATTSTRPGTGPASPPSRCRWR